MDPREFDIVCEPLVEQKSTSIKLHLTNLVPLVLTSAHVSAPSFPSTDRYPKRKSHKHAIGAWIM